MEHEDHDGNKVIQEAAKELYNLTVLAEGKRISDCSHIGDKSSADFSYISTYFQQVQNYLK